MLINIKLIQGVLKVLILEQNFGTWIKDGLHIGFAVFVLNHCNVGIRSRKNL